MTAAKTKKVAYEGPHVGVILSDGTFCARGCSVVVSAALAESLLDQSVWVAATAKTKPSPSRPGAAIHESADELELEAEDIDQGELAQEGED